MNSDSKEKLDAVFDTEKDAGSVVEKEACDLQLRNRWTRKLLSWGVEERGILPVPLEDRTDTQYSKVFFIWLSANFNILSFSAGTLGPLLYGLSLRESCLVILFFNLLCNIPPAYLSTWGPKLGLRQLCQARYSFGYFGVIIMSCFNMATGLGYCILNSILGGQTLSSITNGSLSWSVGIVIIAVVSLLISFGGYKLLAWYERLAWIPVLVSYVVALGLGGKHLSNPAPAEPATASTVLSFASIIAGFVITYAPICSDYTIYYTPDVASWKIFISAYLGFNVPVVMLCFGAAVAVALPYVPAWNDGYNNGNVGGLLEAMLRPAGNFGKFLTVLLALSVTANLAPTFYSFCMSFQVFIPPAAAVPRYMFSLLAVAIVIPLSIAGQHKFYDTLSNFLGIIGYWASAFCAVVLIEHFVIRRSDFSSYNLRYWDDYRRLPPGFAAVCACLLSVGLIVPSMDQVWFVGPIAQRTGDIGFEMAFTVTGLCYVPLRYLELRFRKMV
ncbi:NCS cytosine-purine permease [Laetiporus sulphureus 93-53]|uniref:NCS cytosine-purine permease n=1 Tax=Laetiporus sulphureus 93-53 TaxID=1314785 RepID=A0A165GHV1_9APHY|nr:NCS cytosine-purine permease [Laetiporus sulphureus 93-53]KZT10370.1 NCS cytosine-purine permease [Laetiporus sulphureus 93-53]